MAQLLQHILLTLLLWGSLDGIPVAEMKMLEMRSQRTAVYGLNTLKWLLSEADGKLEKRKEERYFQLAHLNTHCQFQALFS